MAKGFERNQERRRALSGFGKDLARRSRSRCELCEVSGVPLRVHELIPVPVEPDFDRCLFLCGECVAAIENPQGSPARRWRPLTNTVWSEIPAVQIAAVRILRRLAVEERWARDLLEDVGLDPLDPDVEARVEDGD